MKYKQGFWRRWQRPFACILSVVPWQWKGNSRRVPLVIEESTLGVGRCLLVSIALLLAFASVGTAQSCNGVGLHGAPIGGGNLDAYTASGYVGFISEGPTGTFTCAMSVKVLYGQHFLNVHYFEESWVAVPTYFSCGNNGSTYCSNTITLTVSGPGISTDIITLQGNGVTGPPPGDGGVPWVFVSSDEITTWVRTVNRTVDVSAATRSGDATLQFQITDVVPSGSYEGSVGGNFTVGGLITILDPVPSLQNGNQIINDVETLATLGTPVTKHCRRWGGACCAPTARHDARATCNLDLNE